MYNKVQAYSRQFIFTEYPILPLNNIFDMSNYTKFELTGKLLNAAYRSNFAFSKTKTFLYNI